MLYFFTTNYYLPNNAQYILTLTIYVKVNVSIKFVHTIANFMRHKKELIHVRTLQLYLQLVTHLQIIVDMVLCCLLVSDNIFCPSLVLVCKCCLWLLIYTLQSYQWLIRLYEKSRVCKYPVCLLSLSVLVPAKIWLQLWREADGGKELSKQNFSEIAIFEHSCFTSGIVFAENNNCKSAGSTWLLCQFFLMDYLFCVTFRFPTS